MQIAIGADHRGYGYKEYIKKEITHTQDNGLIAWLDVGAHDDERSDYPLFSSRVVKQMRTCNVPRGILLCGSGVGMAIAANRYAGIYAALAWNDEVARMSREDDNTNILVIPADFITADGAVSMVKAWLAAEFKGGRYQERIDMIDVLNGV